MSKSVWKSNSTFIEGGMSIGWLLYECNLFPPMNLVVPKIRAPRGSWFLRDYTTVLQRILQHFTDVTR